MGEIEQVPLCRNKEIQKQTVMEEMGAEDQKTFNEGNKENGMQGTIG